MLIGGAQSQHTTAYGTEHNSLIAGLSIACLVRDSHPHLFSLHPAELTKISPT